MLIGGDFSSKAKTILITLSELSNQNPEQNIEVSSLVDTLQVDKTELKHLLQYLEEKGLISIATIGGPYLYGHIRITEAGIIKATK
jgi:hypothetical protein